MKVCGAQSSVTAFINFVHVSVIKRMVSAGDDVRTHSEKSIAVFRCDAAVFAGVFAVNNYYIRGIAFFKSGHVTAKRFGTNGAYYVAKA